MYRYKKTGCDENGEPQQAGDDQHKPRPSFSPSGDDAQIYSSASRFPKPAAFLALKDYKVPAFLARHEKLFRSIFMNATDVHNVKLPIFKKDSNYERRL